MKKVIRNPIELTTNHTGKMEGIKSLSTSVLLNPNCIKNQKKIGSICNHCYAKSLAKMYSALIVKLENNTKELTTRFLMRADFEVLDKEPKEEQIFRFEAFGDLNNELQLVNYVAICSAFPKIQFALYTKMYKLVMDYFSHHPIPNNLNLIFSSFCVNKPLKASALTKNILGHHPGQVKVFTVYDGDFIKKHPELNINCGARSCNKCRRCYENTPDIYVNEILKSDREGVEMLMKMRKPAVRKRALKNLESILTKFE